MEWLGVAIIVVLGLFALVSVVATVAWAGHAVLGDKDDMGRDVSPKWWFVMGLFAVAAGLIDIFILVRFVKFAWMAD